MARPRKEGLEYFSFDTDFFSDKKIKILKSRYGADGITLYLYLLCEIYKVGYYIKVDEDYEYIFSDDLNMSSEKVTQVMNFLLGRSLFDSKLFQSDKVLTSTGIQKRFQEAIKARASKTCFEVSKYWLLNEEETQPFIKFTQNTSYSEKNTSYSEKNEDYSKNNATKESKVNKSKEKENKEYYPADERLNAAFEEYISFRKKIKSPMTDHAIELAIQKLDELAKDTDTKILILEQSIFRGWKGLFAYEKTTSGNNKVVKTNAFNQYQHHTDMDYEELLNKIKVN